MALVLEDRALLSDILSCIGGELIFTNLGSLLLERQTPALDSDFDCLTSGAAIHLQGCQSACRASKFF